MSERPNIILVSWDSVRADHVPLYGYERDTTPRLSELAEDALVFDDAQIAGVGTPTSFTGLFTGEHATGMQNRPTPNHWRRANSARTLLPEHLQSAGYHTGAFHFNALMSRHFGWNRGWDVFEDHMWTKQKGRDSRWKTMAFNTLQRFDLANFAVHSKKLIQGRTPARWESMWDDISSFVEDAPEPFFLWVLLIDTHHPYYAPEEFQQWPQPGIRSTYVWNYIMRRHPHYVGRRREGIVNAYDNTIRYADAFLETLFEKLDAEGYGEAPLVVHSDHGDELGEHIPHPYGHKPLMYDTLTRVPLVMANVDMSGTIRGPTSLLNVPNTILDLAQCDERLGQRASLLAEDRPREQYVIVQNRMNDQEWMVAVVGETWKLISHPNEPPQAYHRSEDPFEQHNRWGDHPSALEDVLLERLGELEDFDEEEEDDEVVDGAVQERLADLGYLD